MENNGYLRAVIALAPQAVLERETERLDQERASGHFRSPLHGIPILTKVIPAERLLISSVTANNGQDNIATHSDLGMDTTTCSYALAGSTPRQSADLIERASHQHNIRSNS